MSDENNENKFSASETANLNVHYVDGNEVVERSFSEPTASNASDFKRLKVLETLRKVSFPGIQAL